MSASPASPREYAADAEGIGRAKKYPYEGHAKSGKVNKDMLLKRGQRKKTQPEAADRPWYIKPGAFILGKLPSSMREGLVKRVWRYFKGQRTEAEEETQIRCERFLEEELAIIFWGIILTFLLAAACIGYLYSSRDSITLLRNPFGGGDRDQELLLKDKGGSRSVSLTIEEQELASEDMEELFGDFFSDLERNICGKNKSLKRVEYDLVFDEELAGYPFEIEYQPENLSLIGLGGELGKEAEKLKKGETGSTRVMVKASYRSYEKSRTYYITVVSTIKERPLTIYEKAAAKLQELEGKNPRSMEITLPGSLDGMKIQIPGVESRYFTLITLLAIFPILWVFRRYDLLKSMDKKRLKEEQEDFPVIVHLFTLYMNAGLSFASAVHRISRNYHASENMERRKAFEDISVMDKQLDMGVSQKEACVSWGKRSRNPLYQRLSAAMIQILVKGSKEGDRILSHMEEDAFEQRIDRARKEGKMAETKLLFPMVILLCLAMVIVLFPAVIRFSGF